MNDRTLEGSPVADTFRFGGHRTPYRRGFFVNAQLARHDGGPLYSRSRWKTKVIRARVAPQKGKHWYAIKICAGTLTSLGYRRMILSSDHEPAIMV